MRAPLPAARPSTGRLTVASWYGPGFQGRRTSSGEIFNRKRLTAASRTLPLGTHVRVTNLHNGRSVVVRINDRGPYVRGRGIDLSQRAAQRIGMARRGVARVRVERIDAAASMGEARPARRSERESARRRRRAYHRRHYHRRRHHRRRATHHYYYASTAGRRRTPRMVANPVGHWLLGMLR